MTAPGQTVDLTGLAVTNIRDWPTVAAITASVRGGELGPKDAPPAVVVVRLATPLDMRRSGLQYPLFVARCYGATRPAAGLLAAAVVDSIHGRGRRWDTQGRYVFVSHVEDAGGDETDPVTGWPFSPVTFTLTGALGAVAP